MRIIHLVSTFPPYVGGMGNAVWEIARVQAQRGHEVTVVTPQYPQADRQGQRKEIKEGVHIERWRPLAWYGNAAVLPQVLWRLSAFDVVHLHWPFPGTDFFMWLRRVFSSIVIARPKAVAISRLLRFTRNDARQKPKFVVTYHMDLYRLNWRADFFKRVINRTTLPLIMRVADRVIFTNMDFARHSMAARFLSRLGSRAVEIPLGVDVDLFRPEPKSYKLKAESSILFIGALDWQHKSKGLPILLEAFAQLSSYKPQATSHKLLIVGDGDMRRQYEQRARMLSLGDRVEFLGSVPHEKLPEIINQADVVVIPSQMTEAFSLVAVEAMACGKPVIASDLTGLRSVVGEAGVLVPPGDHLALACALDSLLADPAHCASLGIAGRARVEKYFTWERVADLLNRVYQHS